MKIKKLEISQTNFINKLDQYLSIREENSDTIEKTVDSILTNIKKNGDRSLR